MKKRVCELVVGDVFRYLLIECLVFKIAENRLYYRSTGSKFTGSLGKRSKQWVPLVESKEKKLSRPAAVYNNIISRYQEAIKSTDVYKPG